MDFLHKLLNKGANIVHNDVVAPIDRAVHPAPSLPAPNLPSSIPPINVSVATPPTPMMLSPEGRPIPANLPVRYGNITTQTSLPIRGPSPFDIQQQRFNQMTRAQREQALGLNDWQSHWKDVPQGPSRSQYYGLPSGGVRYFDGTSPLTPLIDKLRKIF